MDCDTAISNNTVQAFVTDLVRAERLKHQGCSLYYATVTNSSWQLLTSQTARIKQLQQLDDKMMAMTRYSMTDLLGDMLVDSAKLKPERVFRIQINDIDVRLDMLKNHTMDAMFLPEPQATAARNLKAHVLYDTRHRMHPGVLAFRTDKSKPEFLKHFEAAYNEACDSINVNGLMKYEEIIMRRCHTTQQTVDSLPLDTYLYPHFTAPAENDIKRAEEWLKKKQQ
jgi:NitT/TauT family transport system substrate-binding protein